ncbi:MAG: hypothetical protein ACOX17_00535 [Christensenellales bacterium]|jgi:hypothetical protein
MIKAIVYTSNTGYTAEYARLLSEKTGLVALPLEETKLPAGSEILYMGWLMAGNLQGCKKAAARYTLRCAVGVGMGPSGSQIEGLRKKEILRELPLFTLQGGFDYGRLRGIYRFMMGTMIRTVGRRLAKKPDITPEEKDMLELMTKGGSRVSPENLQPLLDWLEKEGLCERG